MSQRGDLVSQNAPQCVNNCGRWETYQNNDEEGESIHEHAEVEVLQPPAYDKCDHCTHDQTFLHDPICQPLTLEVLDFRQMCCGRARGGGDKVSYIIPGVRIQSA